MLRFDRTVNLAQLTHTDEQTSVGFDCEQIFPIIAQPTTILVDDLRLRAVVVPVANEPLCRGFQVGVSPIEIHVELGKEEVVIADAVAQAQQGRTQWRAMTFAMDVRMLAEQLAEQRRARTRQAGDSDEACGHAETSQTMAAYAKVELIYYFQRRRRR